MANFMQDAFNNVATLVVLVFLGYQLYALARRPRDPSTQVFVVLALAVAALEVVSNVRVLAMIDRGSGIPHLSRPIIDCLGMIVAWALQIWVLHWTYPPAQARARARRRLRLLVATCALLCAFFTLAPVNHEVGDFQSVYAGVAWMPLYYLAFLLFFGFTQIDLCRMSWRYATMVQQRMLRIGLLVIFAGGISGVLYVADVALFTLGRQVGLAPPEWANQLAVRVTQAGQFYLILLGATCSAWLPGVVARLRDHRRYRLLYPLWHALHDAFPELALDPPPPPWLLPRPTHLRGDRLRYLITRMVVEINDGRSRLRGYHDPASTDPGPGPAAPDGARAEAARIAAALRRRAAGAAADDRLSVTDLPGGADLDAEIDWLAGVATAFTRVRRVVAVDGLEVGA
jgi:hypothetical protein